MNKTDMAKDAEKLIALGKDPDLVYGYTLDEYAQMHNDEVDNYDEIKSNINLYSGKIDECSAMIEILKAEVLDITNQVKECEKNIIEYKQRKNTSRNYMEVMEIDDWIKEEEREIENLVGLIKQKNEEIKRLEKEREESIEKLATLKVSLEAMYPTSKQKEELSSPILEASITDDEFVQMTFADETLAVEAIDEMLEAKNTEIDGYAFEMHCLEQDVKAIDDQIAQLLAQRNAKLVEYEAAKQNKERATTQYNEIASSRGKI